VAPRFLAFLATKIAYETNKPGRYARPRHAVLRDRSRPLDPLMVPRRRCLLYSCSCGCLSRVDHVQAAAAARVGRAAAALAGCRCASRRHLEPQLDPATLRDGGSAGTFSDPSFRAACAPSVQCVVRQPGAELRGRSSRHRQGSGRGDTILGLVPVESVFSAVTRIAG